ncbi:MAG: DUF2085 domain-containing protein [Candidatus Thermoplasmatota archaeon]|nr:DUF2085 domain-containing protein [Candidatus Thermoplasmatota archaeon]
MEKREEHSRLILVLFLCFMLWNILQILAPLAISPHTAEDLTGVVGVADNDHLIEQMPVPWNAIYGCGDRLCHQIAERSLFINGNQMPFCSRCTAIWFGFMIGLGIVLLYTIELDEKILVLILFGIIPLAVDGVGQQLQLWQSTNSIRVATGLLTGTVCGVTIGVIIDEINAIRQVKPSN